MILTEEVYLTSNSYINKYYINKGYKVPKIGQKFAVKIKDLQPNSGVRISYECLKCGNIKDCSYYNFTHSKHSGVCQKCSLHKKYDIEKIRIMFDKKDYKLISGIYNDRSEPLLFICKKHRNIGQQTTTLSAFLANKKNCKECKREDIVERISPKIHELIYLCNSKNAEYIYYSDGKVYFICLHHKKQGTQSIRLCKLKHNDIICHYCSKSKLSHDDFISCPNINKYVLILGQYERWNKKIKCKCKKCAYEWFATPNKLMGGSGCPHCKMSKGELLIENLLQKYSLKYEPQHKFIDCKNINSLLFDFYLPDFNTCIEFQGEQHYEPISLLGKTKEERKRKFEVIKKRDKIKRKYCKNHNIKLIEIPYYEQDIEKIIKNIYQNA